MQKETLNKRSLSLLWRALTTLCVESLSNSCKTRRRNIYFLKMIFIIYILATYVLLNIMTNMSLFACLQVFVNSYCLTLFRFACELRLAFHANKSLLFTWKRFLISDVGKVILMYTVSQKVLQINQIPKKTQDQKYLALIS